VTLYLDTSALLKVYLDEEGASVVRAGVARSDIIASSLVAFVETRAAFARRRSANELSPGDYRRLVEGFGDDWERYLKVDVSPPLVTAATRLAETHRLRAYDALHLASALLLAERIADAPTFACWDRALNAAATREGLSLLR
jgi:predicted nucleic acid-binding protein